MPHEHRWIEADYGDRCAGCDMEARGNYLVVCETCQKRGCRFCIGRDRVHKRSTVRRS